MAQQILYATATGEIIQWQDTAAFNYAAAPSGTATLAVTPAQWAEQSGAFYVSSGALVAGTLPSVAPTLAAAQASQIATINAACQTALAAVVAAYPDLEVATWPQQYAEAQAYTANPATAATPMLSAIATACDSTVAAMAAGVIAKASAYQAASGAAIGRRLLLTGEIDAATTVAAALAVAW